MEMVTEPLGQELVWRREDGNHLIKRKRKMASPPCVGKGAKRRVKGEGLHCFTVSRQEDDERPNQPKQKLMFFSLDFRKNFPDFTQINHSYLVGFLKGCRFSV